MRERIWERYGFFVPALLLVGLATRIYGLGFEDIWLDEAITWQRASLPVDALIADSIRRLHNPSYFLFMHYWIDLVGDDEWSLRLPAAIAGTLKVCAVGILGRVVGGTRVGYTSALLVALSPAAIRYDQEARMYAFEILGSTTALAGAFWLFVNPRPATSGIFGGALPDAGVATHAIGKARLAWLAFIAGGTLAMYSHNTAAVFLLSTSAASLVAIASCGAERRRFVSYWTLANLAVLAAWSPYCYAAFVEQHAAFTKKFRALDTSPDAIYSVLDETHLLGAGSTWLGALLLLLAVAGLWGLRRRPGLAAMLLLVGIGGPALTLLLSLKKSIFMMRVVLWSGIPIAVLIALGIEAISLDRLRGFRGLVFTALLLVGGVHARDSYYRINHNPRWQDLIAEVNKSPRGQARIIISAAGREGRQLRYYFRRATSRLPGSYILNTKLATSRLEEFVRGRTDVWVVWKRKTKDRKRIERGLRRMGAKRVSRKGFGRGLHMARYSLPPPK